MRKVGSRTWVLGPVTIAAAVFTVGWAGRGLAQEKLGSEFQVNTYTTADQRDSAVAADASGNFVVVWESWRQDGDDLGVFGQRFDSTGTKVGGEFQVNTYTTGYQHDPQVAAHPSGRFVVAWAGCRDGDDSACEIFGQRFESAGVKLGGEFQVNTYTTYEQQRPAVTVDANGDFVVVWESEYIDGFSFGVAGQRFDSAGAKDGGEFQVNTFTAGRQYLPSVASDAIGSFVVVWQSNYQDGDSDGVFGQRFDSTGTKDGGEFQVNTFSTGYQSRPSVASNGSGFVVAWEHYAYIEGEGTSYDVHGQRFDGTGAKVGGELQLNTSTGKHFRPAVAADASDNFVVAWERSYPGDARFSPGLFGQRFDGAGNKLGDEFQVNTYTTSSQYDPAVAADPSGNFVVAWESYQDGSISGVFGQRFSALRSGCRAAAVQDVSLKAHAGKLDWSWSQGDATSATDLGDPTDDTAYHVCLYDEFSGTPAGLCVEVPPGAGWTAEENGFRFESKTGVQGIRAIRLEAGAAGQAEVAVQGKGVALPELPLTQQPEVVLELSNSVGQCWQSRFATARKNDASKFTANE